MDKWTYIKVPIGMQNTIELSPRRDEIFFKITKNEAVSTLSFAQAKALIRTLQYIIDAGEQGNWPD